MDLSMICGSYFRKCAPCEDEEGKDVSFMVDRRGFSSRCANMPPACLLPVLLLADARARPELFSKLAYDQKRHHPQGWCLFLVDLKGFEPASSSIIFCYYSYYQLILSFFQNFLYRLNTSHAFSFQSVKGKNKGNCLLPSSGNYAIKTYHFNSFGAL